MKIMVTTDGTQESLCILPHAGRIAAAVGAELALLRVLDPRVDAADVIAQTVGEAVAQVREQWAGELREELAQRGMAGEAVIAERKWGESVADTIHRAADELPAAMLGMASRGRGAVKHIILGSVSMDVVSKADLPVMVLTGCPPIADDDREFRLLITSDGSPDARSVFEGLATFLVAGTTKVTLLEIAIMAAGETEDEAAERVRGPLEAVRERFLSGVDCDVAVRVVPAAASIDLAISAAAKELGVDAIASATHGHSARRHLVAGSVAQGVINHAEVPVILVKSRAVD